MNKNVIICIVVVVILIILGAWYMKTDKVVPSEGATSTPAALVSERDVDAVSEDAGIDAEFQAIDSDINQL